MAESHSADPLPRMLVVVREPAGSGWRIQALGCEPDDLTRELRGLGIAASEKRVLGTGGVAQRHLCRFIAQRAFERGWYRDQKSDLWYPIEEPLPIRFRAAEYSDVTLSLTSIMWGGVVIAIEVNEHLGCGEAKITKIVNIGGGLVGHGVRVLLRAQRLKKQSRIHGPARPVACRASCSGYIEPRFDEGGVLRAGHSLRAER